MHRRGSTAARWRVLRAWRSARRYLAVSLLPGASASQHLTAPLPTSVKRNVSYMVSSKSVQWIYDWVLDYAGYMAHLISRILDIRQKTDTELDIRWNPDLGIHPYTLYFWYLTEMKVKKICAVFDSFLKGFPATLQIQINCKLGGQLWGGLIPFKAGARLITLSVGPIVNSSDSGQ